MYTCRAVHDTSMPDQPDIVAQFNYAYFTCIIRSNGLIFNSSVYNGHFRYKLRGECIN